MEQENEGHILTAAERRDAWGSGFSYGENGHFWDYAQWIAEMLIDVLGRVEELVGAEHAAEPLRALVEPVVQDEGTSAETWREAIEENVLSAGTIWPVAKRIDDAGLYGLYGVTPADVPVHERSGWLDKLVSDVTSFAERHGLLEAVGDENAITRIVKIARARRALDTGEGEVDLGSMSIFGGVSEGRLRNLMSGASPTLERSPRGGIAAVSALAWLQNRRDFYRSIWDQDDTGDHGSGEGAAPIDPLRMIFVPVARDNSTFHPGLARNGQFQIGGKGEEQHFASFDEALQALNAMPVPRWRRPNEHGNWGIVSGVAWQRIERHAPDAN